MSNTCAGTDQGVHDMTTCRACRSDLGAYLGVVEDRGVVLDGTSVMSMCTNVAAPTPATRVSAVTTTTCTMGHIPVL